MAYGEPKLDYTNYQNHNEQPPGDISFPTQIS